MIIDLTTIKNLAAQPGRSHYFEMQPSARMGREAGLRFLSPVKLELVFQRSGNGILLKGRYHATLEMSCSRCLQVFPHIISGGFQAVLVEEADWRQPAGSEENVYFIDQGFDPAPLMEETILLNLPLSSHCTETCRGLCPRCGIDRNVKTCTCHQEDIDPRWEKLKQLKNK